MNAKICIIISAILVLLAGCAGAPQLQAGYDPATLRFDGEQAYEILEEFVTTYPYRASGQPNNLLAAEWLQGQFSQNGWDCQIDAWQVINYSRPVPMRNVVCRLEGQSPKEIVVAAHHDQSTLTIQGANNDGSGIATLLELSEIFASEGKPPYTLVFVSTDGEEYGMLGTRRLVQTHPDTGNIIAFISLDQVGKIYNTGMDIEAVGQFRKFGALWLQLLAGEAARAAGDLWVPKVRSPFDQVIAQAVPLSFMDQGPMVAAGVPALGFTGKVPPEYAALHWQTYHSPDDNMELQSKDVLQQSGRITEALIRQLLVMDSYPQESGPYVYFESSQQVLRGAPLWLLFTGWVALFFLGSFFIGGRDIRNKVQGWRKALPHFLGLWLPLVASILMLYLFVAVGLMDQYELYPATTKDPETLNPHWPAVILFLLSFSVFLALGRRLVRRFAGETPAPDFKAVKRFGLFIVGLASLYVLVVNPFSLLFTLPLAFWFLINHRKGAWRLLDILFFLLGGLVVYALFYFFGFAIQHLNFAVLWYMLIMFSIGEIGFLTALAITAMIAAGLAMVVNPPVKAIGKTVDAPSPITIDTQPVR